MIPRRLKPPLKSVPCIAAVRALCQPKATTSFTEDAETASWAVRARSSAPGASAGVRDDVIEEAAVTALLKPCLPLSWRLYCVSFPGRASR
jgi:hypothetical protein